MVCVFTTVAQAQLQHNARTTSQTWIATSGSFALAGGSFFLQQRVQPLSIDQITALQTRSFSGIAAYPTSRFDRSAARTSDVLTLATAVLPATILLFEGGRNEVGRGLHMYMQTAFLNFAVTNFTKTAVRRNRPFVYNPNVPMHLKHERDARLSFFSGHTSTAASFCFFTASMVQAYSSNRTVKTITWIGAAVVPAITGYLRMRAGKHFFSDVVVGYAAGAAIGLGVPLAHRKRTATPR